MNITHYDLFAGIGGFSLALEEVFNEAKINHIFCEWAEFPAAVLKKHWPNEIFYGDIADLIADTDSQRHKSSFTKSETKRRFNLCSRARSDENETLTILTGGFPCQPFSHAGRRKGTADDRYQWPNMFRVIQKMSNQTGSSLKMCVGLLLGTTAWYSSRCALTWKAKATKSNRLLFQLSPSTPRTAGTGSGLLLTPRTRETEQDLEKFKARMAKYRNGTTMPNLATQIGAETGEKLRLQPAMPEWMMGFPEKWTEFPTASPNGETNRSKPTATP